MLLPRYFLCVVLALAVIGCSPRNFDPAAEGQKLLRRDAEWADLATAGKEIEKIVSYWSDDAVLIFPGQPVLEGKGAIRAYVTASLKTPGFKIHWAPTFHSSQSSTSPSFAQLQFHSIDAKSLTKRMTCQK